MQFMSFGKMTRNQSSPMLIDLAKCFQLNQQVKNLDEVKSRNSIIKPKCLYCSFVTQCTENKNKE